MNKNTKPVVAGFDGPRKTALGSIRNFCMQCMGGSHALVTDCPSISCIFFPYRSGVIKDGADRRLQRIIKQYCNEQCLQKENSKDCMAGKVYMDLEPCPLWPFRTVRSPYYGEKRREKQRHQALTSSSGAYFRSKLNGITQSDSSVHGVA